MFVNVVNMSVNKLLIIILSFLTLAFPTLAVARQFTPGALLGNGEYAVNQNPDETWTEWMGGKNPGEPIEGTTYTSAEMDEAMGNAGYTVDNLGGYSTSSADIVGGNMKEFEAGKALYKNIAKGQLYMDVSASEEAIGKWATTVARVEGVLPTVARAASFIGDVGLAVGAFGVGVAIGNGIDEILGFETLGLSGGTSHTEARVPTEVGRYNGEFQINGPCYNLSTTKIEESNYMLEGGGPYWNTYGHGAVCVVALPHVEVAACRVTGGEFSEVYHCPELAGAGTFHCSGTCFPQEQLYWNPVTDTGASTFVTHPDPPLNAFTREDSGSITITYSTNLGEEAMPQRFGEEIPTGFTQNSTVAPTRPPPEPFTRPVPASVPAPVKVFVLEPEPGKEGKKLPSPLLPEIPHAIPNEIGTHYVTRLKNEGWPNVELHTLPETAMDPNVGPEGVSYTAPAEGTHESTKTIHVDVEQNPTNAPIPAETPNKIGPPTEPGFKLPKFGVLCKGFPFGVPCWLVKTIEGWSATPKAPEWGLEEFSIKGKKVSGSKFHLSQLEPIMEKVRPAILIFVTIGIVLLFYKFAKGGGPEGGSGGGVDTTETYYDGPNEYRVS
jgi:hypothetical protein